MSKLKDSEQMLCFLNDLSKFTQTFSTLNNDIGAQGKSESEKKPTHGQEDSKEPQKEQRNERQKEPQSPTVGIADEFIQNILDSYLKKR